MDKPYRIGLVLSGGGPRGFAHFGVLQALDELGIRIDCVAGTSAGAVAGAFYTAGYAPADAFKLIRSYSLWRWAAFFGRQPGLLNFRRAQKLFGKYLPATFAELKRPLLISATDIHAGTSVVFSEGPLVAVMCASSAIPVLFKPVEFDGRVFVDGGVLNNFPADLLREQCTHIIGVNVNPVIPTSGKIGRLELVDRSIRLAIRRETEQKRVLCDVFLEPPGCNHVNLLELKAAERLREDGYRHTLSMRDELLALIREPKVH